MNQIQTRLVKCFAAAFPGLRKTEIPVARADTLAQWDSLATITLLQLIEDEFGVSIDFEQIEALTSFAKVHDYLRTRDPQ